MQALRRAVGTLQRPEGTIAAVSHLSDAHRSPDERDPLVACLQQMRHGQIAAQHVID